VKTAAKPQLERRKPVSDDRLVARCRQGDEQAWATLVDKYKNLIYSIPIKLGLYDDAADIFQAVCLDLLTSLPNLREPRALPKWLMQVCYHKCLHYRAGAKKEVRLAEAGDEGLDAQEDASPLPEDMLAQLEREQMVRSVVSGLTARCERMVRMLFFETPPRPYQEIAKELGVATGSIGFLRGRCLIRMRKELEKMGFQ
jgi:RNA polymerase sigma factor (sigma-70 family)